MGLALAASASTPALASFDVDGERSTSISIETLRLRARPAFSHNLIRLSGFGDQCTAYALDRMHAATGMWMPLRGNAYEWASEAEAAGWPVGSRPLTRSVVVMPPAPGYRYTIHDRRHGTYETVMHPYGHVGWVERVEGDWILIHDQNWSRGEIGERWVLAKDSPMRYIYSR